MTDTEILTAIWLTHNNFCPFCHANLVLPSPRTLVIQKHGIKLKFEQLAPLVEAESQRYRDLGIDPDTMHRRDCERPKMPRVVL